jgi:hypothetical protein
MTGVASRSPGCIFPRYQPLGNALLRQRVARDNPRPPISLHISVAGSLGAAHDGSVRAKHNLYCIRVKGRLGVTALSAFPTMAHRVDGTETVLTGLLEDRSAVFGVLGQVEALGLELIEFRQIRKSRRPGSSGDGWPEYRW